MSVQSTVGPTFVRKSNFIEKMVSSKLFWLIACTFLFAYPISKSINRMLPDELPILSAVPDFRFTDENGKTFGTNELKGKVYIANFMFTSCKTACPILLKKVQTVQHRIRGVIDRAAIVSFTVDPETDTSKVLFDKARELKANPIVWRFLTASPEDTKKLLVDGFKVPVGEKEIANSIMDVAHSNKLVLVDQDGNIRGYYSIENDGINKLMIDTGLLINRKKKS
jgi:protein SCO1/2